MGLERVCKLDPEKDRGQGEHRQVTGRELVVPGGNASILFQSVEQALHPVALAVGLPVERPAMALVRATRNGGADAPLPQEAAHRAVAVAFVADNALRPTAWTARSPTFDCSVIQELREDGDFMAFAARQDKRHRLALSFRPHMDFRTEAATRAA